MVFKFAVVLCLFGLAHAGNLFGGSGFGASLSYGSRYTSLGHASGLEYSSLGHRSSLGYGSAYSALGHGSGLGYSGTHGYGGYGASGYSRPAISTVSINKYSGPATPYATGLGAHGVYTPAISGAYGAHGAYTPAISGGYGYSGAHGVYTPAISSGYGYGSGAYGGYGASAYSRPAVSTVSVTKYIGSVTPYSGFRNQGAYAPAISGAYGAHGAYAPAVSSSYGYGGYGYGSGAYGNKW